MARRYWTRLALYGRRRQSMEDLNFDRPMCRGRNLPPPYSLDYAGQAAFENSDGFDGSNSKYDGYNNVQTNSGQLPSYALFESDSNSRDGTSSFNILVANIQYMLSIQSQGGKEFLELLETQPRYLLDVLQQHQQENQDCVLNQPNADQ